MPGLETWGAGERPGRAFSMRRQEGSRQGGGRGLWRLKGRLVPKVRGRSAQERRGAGEKQWFRDGDQTQDVLRGRPRGGANRAGIHHDAGVREARLGWWL
jgi:hypothetical protein